MGKERASARAMRQAGVRGRPFRLRPVLRFAGVTLKSSHGCVFGHGSELGRSDIVFLLAHLHVDFGLGGRVEERRGIAPAEAVVRVRGVGQVGQHGGAADGVVLAHLKWHNMTSENKSRGECHPGRPAKGTTTKGRKQKGRVPAAL